MSIDELPENPLPLWMKIVIVACGLPVLAFPALLNRCPEGSTAEIFLWIYPFYTLLACVLAWRCWGRRPELTWVLLLVLLLTHAAMWVLVDPTIVLP